MADTRRPNQLRAFWVYARQTDRLRFAGGSSLWPPDIYSRYVQREMVGAGILPEGADLDLDRSTPAEWNAGFSHLSAHVVGLLLCRPASMASLMLYLGRQQRSVQDFWLLTPYASCPLFFMEVVACALLRDPVVAYTNQPGFAASGSFFTLTQPSAQRCVETASLGAGEVLLRDILGRWAEQHNEGRSLMEDEGLRDTIAMHIPHALLCSP